MKEDLIKRLVALGFKNARIETDLKLPKNSLSAVLNGHKNMPTKWVSPVEQYLFQHEPSIHPEAQFPLSIDECTQEEPWIEVVRDFCKKEKVTPEEIIKWYKTSEMSHNPSVNEEKPYPYNWSTMDRFERLKWLTANR